MCPSFGINYALPPRRCPLPNAVISLALGRLPLPKASRRVALRRVAGIVAAHFAWAQQLFQGPVPIAILLPLPAHWVEGRRRFCCLLCYASCLLPAVCFSLCFDFYFAIAIDKQRPSPCLKVSWFFVFRALWRCLWPPSNPLSFQSPLQLAFSCSLRFLMLLAGIPKELIAVLNRARLSRAEAQLAMREARSENWELRTKKRTKRTLSSPAGTQKQVLKALSGSQINALVKISTLLADKCECDYLKVKCLTGNNVQELFHNWTELGSWD